HCSERESAILRKRQVGERRLLGLPDRGQTPASVRRRGSLLPPGRSPAAAIDALSPDDCSIEKPRQGDIAYRAAALCGPVLSACRNASKSVSSVLVNDSSKPSGISDTLERCIDLIWLRGMRTSPCGPVTNSTASRDCERITPDSRSFPTSTR